VSNPPIRLGFWSDKEYHLDKMNLRELALAYFQYYAIAAYILVAFVTGGFVLRDVMIGSAALWPVAA